MVKYLVISGPEVQGDDPVAKGDIQDGLQVDDLGYDHPGVSHWVFKTVHWTPS